MATPSVDDQLWEVIGPPAAQPPRRYRHPGRKHLDDRACLEGILYMLATGIAWKDLPQQLG